MHGQLIRVGTAAAVAFLPALLTLSTEARAFRLLWTQEATIADIEGCSR
jgi:hypothetical protein